MNKLNTLTFLKLSVSFLFLMTAFLSYSFVFLKQSFSQGTIISLVSLVVIISVLLVLVSYIKLNNYSKEIKKMNNLAKLSADGKLYHRITYINNNEEIGQLAWSMNNMLDQFEAFSRDLDASLKLTSEGKSYRRMMPSGLHGDFVKYSQNINAALETIAVAQSKDEIIQELLKTLEEYKNGDYRGKLELTDMPEDILKLASGINNLGDALSDLSQINLKNGLALQQGSDVLSQNVNQLNVSANNQAKSLEQTSSILGEITSNIKENTQNTVQMAQYADELTGSAKQGEDLANKTAMSMDEINTQTSAINEAITVIDQIAFQTNILSLNAAVEAATAGEAGKGFAVVAQEVRNLASRSADAAKEIKDLVENATSKTNEGKIIADDMIAGYNKLNENIKSTMDLINNVTSSSKEQELSITQINESISILDRQTKESAKIAHDTNIVAHNSSDIAKRIVEEANKEFDGKNNIRIRDSITNQNHTGVEKRKIETMISKNEL